MVASAQALMTAVMAGAFKPRQALRIDAWAELHRVIADKAAVEPGPMRIARTPYMRRWLRAMAHPDVRQVTLMTATQVAKTEALETFKCWIPAENPGPTMVMMPTEKVSEDFNRDRFIPNLQMCAPTAAHLTTRPRDIKNDKVDFDNCVFWMVPSNSDAARAGRSVQTFIGDEVDKFDPAWVNVRSRSKARADAKQVLASSPKLAEAESGIHHFYLLGDRQSYWVPCPHPPCGRFQVLKFEDGDGGLRWEGGRHASGDQAEGTAHYVCKHCGGKIHDYHKPAMLAGGVWVPEGGDLDLSRERDRLAEDDPYGMEPYPVANMSFWISSLYSPFAMASFGKTAREFVETCRGRPTPYFVNDWLGEPWIVPGDRTELAELRKICVTIAEDGYRTGTVPLGVLGIVVTADVQGDELVVAVRGYGERGEDTWLIEALSIPRKKGANLIELDRWLGVDAGGTKKKWANAAGRTYGVAALGIDSGNFADEVYEATRRLKAAGVNAYSVKGDGKDSGSRGAGVPTRLTRIDVFPGSKRPIPGGVRLLTFNSDYWKTSLLGRIRGRVIADAEVGDGDPAAVRGFYLPSNEAGELERYLHEMVAEHRVQETGTDHKPKAMQYRWAVRRQGLDNHFWDAEYYNAALADWVGVRKLGTRTPALAAGAEPQTPAEGDGDRRFGTAPWQRGGR